MPARVQLTPRRIQHSGKIGGRPVLARGLPPLVTEIAKDRDFRSTIEDLATSRRNSQGLSSPGGDLPKIFSFSRRDVRVGSFAAQTVFSTLQPHFPLFQKRRRTSISACTPPERPRNEEQPSVSGVVSPAISRTGYTAHARCVVSKPRHPAW